MEPANTGKVDAVQWLKGTEHWNLITVELKVSDEVEIHLGAEGLSTLMARLRLLETGRTDQIGDDFESITYFGDAEWDQRACLGRGWSFVAVRPELGGIESYVGINR